MEEEPADGAAALTEERDRVTGRSEAKEVSCKVRFDIAIGE